MKNQKKHIIRKVPLYTFISLLNNLYENGADFVDLHGEIDEEGIQDNITVGVPIEYMSEESRGSLEENGSPPPDVEYDENEFLFLEEPKVFTREHIISLLKNV